MSTVLTQQEVTAQRRHYRYHVSHALLQHRKALAAIVKARTWIDDIRLGRIASFAEIAKREAQCERHIRLLAPLAFVSPRIIAAIIDGSAPANLTVTGLAKALPYSWVEQERTIAAFETAIFAPISRSPPDSASRTRSLSSIEPVSGMLCGELDGFLPGLSRQEIR